MVSAVLVLTKVLDRAALTFVSSPVGLTLLDAAEALPVPAEFVALTVKVQLVPLVRPVTVIVQAAGPAQVPVKAPGEEVAV